MKQEIIKKTQELKTLDERSYYSCYQESIIIFAAGNLPSGQPTNLSVLLKEFITAGVAIIKILLGKHFAWL